jgi:GTPase SAR1 family protein
MFKALKSGIRLRDLKRRLQKENPILTEVVDSFQAVDQIGRRLGFLSKEESFAASTSWWPLISVLGLYSSGKSSFINHYLQFKLQATGNQAVDDKFTVICFTNEKKERVLDAYLQLKTCPSEKLRGKILVDSPGFDADAQRTSTLQITDHIIDLSDLVLVFFDARHPETGSMQDTLQHMVSQTISRSDSNKFLYILNQIDMTAAENNTEEVFAAWQRALAQYGLTAGCCYAIYVPEVATHIENPEVRSRLESKRDMYLQFIYDRIEQVGVERAYRIAGILESTTRMLKQEVVPRVQQFIFSWRRLVLWTDAIILGAVLAVFLMITIYGGFWNGLSFRLPFLETSPGGNYGGIVLAGLAVGIAGYIHFRIRRWAAKRAAKRIIADINDPDLHSNYIRTFEKNSRWYCTLFRRQPAGWGQRSSLGLEKILEDSNLYIQKLNDMYTNPSGDDTSHPIIVPEYSEKTPAVDLQDSREVDVIREEASKNTTMH